ncbi:DNA-binding response regulator [Salinibacterium xinjiangense]|uniref:Two component transcriptional regulator, LuxR family n=1 Tax=Salinibacterium xinjiangense TaxID=386302 RepID=A0A2C8YD85_9MICO|nr:response regulator transcription factor [Salinibacterium xinjiangense]GGK96513.1 DNA-binding response regulator [Salinibacterium xinjiangense]SOE48272.1 two component transcriptional regulator, LuxR family [Salinibacterium xinjiangense]
MIRVFLLDDHELVRRGISALLGAEVDIEVVGEASTAAQAIGRIRATTPDVAVLDVRLPDGSGIDVCRDIRSSLPGTRCLMLTGYDDDEAIYAAVLAGASGYVIKDIRGSGLVDSVRAVAAGRSLLDPALNRRVVERINENHEADPRLQSLTIRERQILPLIAEGLTNREIGERLNLAEKTVKNYISGLLSKLGLQRRTQAAVLHLESKQP